jgi:NitT/TauT family transport system substrate-binding protein
VVSLKSANIRKPADLKGKKIGVYSLSSGTRQNLLVLLHQAGLKESDVTIVVTGLLNFAPLMQGQVDATAATDTGLLVGRKKGIGEVNVMEVGQHLNVSSDLFVVREPYYQQNKPLLRRFLQAYRDSAAWMIANPDEAAGLAMKVAIDGTDRATNFDIIRLRNASSVSERTAKHGLGSMDLDTLQKAADAYRELGLISQPIRMSDVVASDLLPPSP